MRPRVTLRCSYEHELSVMNHLKSFMPTSFDNQQLSEHCSYRLPSAHEDDTGQSQSVRGSLQNSRSYSPSALLSVTEASTTQTLEMNNDKHTALHMHPQPNIDRQRVVMLRWETGCLLLIMLQQLYAGAEQVMQQLPAADAHLPSVTSLHR